MATSLCYNNSNGECALGFKFDCSDRVFGYLYDGKSIVLADEQEFSKKYYDYIKPVKSPDDMETFFRTTGSIGFAEELLLSRCNRYRVEGCGQTHGEEEDEIRHFFNDSILYVLTKALINAKPKEEKNDGVCYFKTEKPRGEGRGFEPTVGFVSFGNRVDDKPTDSFVLFNDRTDDKPKGTRRIVRYIGKDEGNIVNGHFYLLVEKADNEHSVIIVPPENKPVTVSDQNLEFSDRPKWKEPETKKPKARKDDSVAKIVEDELFDTMEGIVEKKKAKKKKRATFNYDYWDGYINF